MGLKLGVMNKREEKTDFKRTIDSIPLDLIREIFVRLPAKSLVRFRCVSKLWFSITTDPHFINSFAIQSSTRPCLQLSFESEDKLIFFSLTQKSLSQHHEENCHMVTLQRKYRFKNDFESMRGLISFPYYQWFVIWNPTIRQHVTIPKPEDSWHARSFLGYDPIGDAYKVLCMSNTSDSGPLVLTLRDQESWREIKNIPMHYMAYSGKYINGFIYYEAFLRYADYAILADSGSVLRSGEGEDEKTIMRFDVRSENFKPIQMPPYCTHDTRHALVNYEGKLARVCQEFSTIKLWILEDVDKEKWSYKDFCVPFPPEDMVEIFYDDYYLNDLVEQKKYYILYDIADDTGEFIFISSTIWCRDREAYVLCYDPKKKRTRKVKFEGNGYGQNFKRDYGGYLGAGNWYFVYCFSNHIESLMPLNNLTFSHFV